MLPDKARPGRARRARALHGRLRQRAGLRGRPRAGDAARTRRPSRPPRARARTRMRTSRRSISPPIRQQGGYALLRRLRLRQAHARRHHQDRRATRACAALAAPAFRPVANGRWCARRAGPRLMAVNGDEGEPGTFKDRHYLGLDPHRFIEGMLIAAWVVEAADIYVYIRDEYPELIADAARASSRASPMRDLRTHATIHLRRGAGAYICGEESAMIESIEGKRGLPRHRPPYVAQVGLFGRPTLEQNVETLYWVRDIVEKGAAWFTVAGPPRAQGLPLVLGLGPREEAGRGAGAGRRHGARTDRGILRRHGRRPRLQGLSAGRRVGRHPAGLDGGRAASTSARWKNTAASSAPTRLSSCPTRTT